jgi:hypothetical protein
LFVPGFATSQVTLEALPSTDTVALASEGSTARISVCKVDARSARLVATAGSVIVPSFAPPESATSAVSLAAGAL